MRDVVRRIVPGDDEFPDALADAKPPVEQLWVKGRSLTELAPFVAIVGARRASAYGLDIARHFAATLAREGWCVVSGLAKGIDAAAHQGALGTTGRTVAVLGCGIDIAYPASNRWLYEQIAEQGALVSEYEPGTQPQKWLFPARNRIIAHLCAGTILVQARAETSGAFGTAKLAGEKGRTVFAVPGDLRSELSKGPHSLIAEGATFCHDPSVVTDMLTHEARHAEARAAVDIPAELPPEQAAVLARVRSSPAKVDDLVDATDMDVMQVNRALARLERGGFLIRLDGGVYRAAR